MMIFSLMKRDNKRSSFVFQFQGVIGEVDWFTTILVKLVVANSWGASIFNKPSPQALGKNLFLSFRGMSFTTQISLFSKQY